MPVLSFGKYAGTELAQVPREYLEWLIDSRKRDLLTYETELERREFAECANATMVERVVTEGFKALARKLHPDAGGTDSQFRELKAAQEALVRVVAELVKTGVVPDNRMDGASSGSAG